MAFNFFFALKKSIWKGFLPIIYPLFKALKKLLKSQSNFLQDLPFHLSDVELDFHLSMAILQPEKFSRKVAKLLSKANDNAIKNQINRKLKNVTLISSYHKNLNRCQ